MQTKKSTYVEFGTRRTVVRTYISLVPETEDEKALVNAMYGLKGRASTYHNGVALEFTRVVETK